MKKQTIEWYKKNFPSLDLNKQPSDEEMLMIYSAFDKDLNLKNPIIVSKLLAHGNELRGMVEIYKIIKSIVNPSGKLGGSRRSKTYWLVRGYSEDEARRFTSEIQKENSPRCVEYWVKRGYTKDEAIVKVKETQSQNAIKFHQKVKSNGSSVSRWNKNYWIARGLSEEEAAEKVTALQTSNGNKYAQKYSAEERRKHQPWCVEYWISQGKTEDEYAEFMSSRYAYCSKSSVRFFDSLCEEIQFVKPHYGEREFGKFIKGLGYVKYDFVDTALKIVIEYDSEFWHRSEEAKRRDAVKQEFMEGLGYKVF